MTFAHGILSYIDELIFYKTNMQIKYIESSLVFEGKNASAVLLRSLVDLTKVQSSKYKEASIITCLNELANKADNIITNAGEYEYNDILFYILSTDYSSNADVIVCDVEEIKIVYLASHVVDLPKFVKDKLGEVHILVLEIDEDNFNKKMDLINEIEPNKVLPLTSKTELISKIANELGVQTPEILDKVSFIRDDFDEEDAITSLTLLK